MINKLKDLKITKRGIYISIAICMLLIGCIGIFTAVRNMDKIVDETDFVYTEPDDVSDVLTPSLSEMLQKKEESSPTVTEPEEIILNFIKPVDGDISKNHSGSDLVYSETMNDYRTHSGIDIAAPEGTTVLSSEGGTIVSIENHPLWGTTVEIEHANGFETCYKNLADSLPEGIETGSYVSSGGIIGVVGSTALVEIGEKPHLHFEMSVNGIPVDPTEYLS